MPSQVPFPRMTGPPRSVLLPDLVPDAMDSGVYMMNYYYDSHKFFLTYINKKRTEV